MKKIKSKAHFIKGDAIPGANYYELIELSKTDYTKIPFMNEGVIKADGTLDNGPNTWEKHHTSHILIDNLVDGPYGVCVQSFDPGYTDYPKVLFFSDTSLGSFISCLTVTQIGKKTSLTADEVKSLAANAPGAKYVVFNSDFEDGGEDFVYVRDKSAYNLLVARSVHQQAIFHGCIGEDGTPYQNRRAFCELNTEYQLQPLTKLHATGRSYYIKVEVPLEVVLDTGTYIDLREAYVYLDSSNPVNFIATYLGVRTYESGCYVTLESNLGSIKLFKCPEQSSVLSTSIFTDDQFYLNDAMPDWQHTDFIPLDALTNAYLGDLGQQSCINGFKHNGVDKVCEMAFYSGPSYDEFLAGADFSEFGAMAAVTVKNYADSACAGIGEAKYVVFSANKKDAVRLTTFGSLGHFVSVGGIWFNLNTIAKLTDGYTHTLAVRAKDSNNGMISECSNEVEYTCEFAGIPVESVFDVTGDGVPEVYMFSKALPVRFNSENAIHIDAVADIVDNTGAQRPAGVNSHYMEYDEVAAGYENPMPDAHVYCHDDKTKNHYLRYTFDVPEDGIYELAVHLRIKDEKLRGATYTFNEGYPAVHAFATTYGWDTEKEALAVRNSDALQGAYMSGMQVYHISAF